MFLSFSKVEKLLEAGRLFHLSAQADDGSSGSPLIEEYACKAESLVREVIPEIDIFYPGLYPAFRVGGNEMLSVEELYNYLCLRHKKI